MTAARRERAEGPGHGHTPAGPLGGLLALTSLRYLKQASGEALGLGSALAPQPAYPSTPSARQHLVGFSKTMHQPVTLNRQSSGHGNPELGTALAVVLRAGLYQSQ